MKLIKKLDDFSQLNLNAVSIATGKYAIIFDVPFDSENYVQKKVINDDWQTLTSYENENIKFYSLWQHDGGTSSTPDSLLVEYDKVEAMMKEINKNNTNYSKYKLNEDDIITIEVTEADTHLIFDPNCYTDFTKAVMNENEFYTPFIHFDKSVKTKLSLYPEFQ